MSAPGRHRPVSMGMACSEGFARVRGSNGELGMAARRIHLILIGVLVLSGTVSGGSPAIAASASAPAPASSPVQASDDARPDPTSGPRPGPGAASRPKPAPKTDAVPRPADVPPGTRLQAAPSTADTGGRAPAGCRGAARFGKIFHCPSLSKKRQDLYTVTTTVDDDVLYGTVTQTSNDGGTDSVSAKVYDSAGEYLCYFTSSPGSCRLGAAGTYQVRVALSYGSGDLAYTFSVQSMKTPSSCTTLGGDAFFSFASAGRSLALPRGSAGQCYDFDQPVGSVLHLFSPQSAGDVQGQILDARDEPLCTIRYDWQCTLNSAGPYRVFMYESYGAAADYTLRMARISNSAGCPVLRPVSFGDPAASAGTGSVERHDSVACHKLRAPTAGAVAIRMDDDQQIWWNVYDDAGQRICDKYDSAWSCMLPAAGDYTILTSNQDWDPNSYRIAVAALSRPSGCILGTSTAWDQDAVLLHQTSALQTNCQQFRGTAGQRVVTYAAPTRYNEVYPVLVDATGRALCLDHSEETGCVLPADGTYRVVTFLKFWDADDRDETYKVQLRSLTSPVGCPVAGTGAYNAPPALGLAPIRCRTLRIAQSGVHHVKALDAANYRTSASVYDASGHRICDNSGYCDLPAAGDYTLVLAGQSSGTVIDNQFQYVTSVLPSRPAGCPVLSGDLYRGVFTDPGQYLCVQLRQAAGERVIELVPTDTKYPDTSVFDAAGQYVCDSSYELRQSSCELTGDGPHVAVLGQQEGQAPTAFAAQFLRVDGPPSCPALDASVLTTGGDNFAVCRGIPADEHGERESFTWKRLSGTGGASLSVFDAAGIKYCGPTGTFPERTFTCSLPAGPLTVVLNAASTDATYQLSRQPVAAS